MSKLKMCISQLKDNSRNAAELLKVMSNECRLLILCHLWTGERNVRQLEELLELSQSSISQHLAILRRERIVKTRRSAQSVYYTLDSDYVVAVMGTLYERFCKVD